MATTRALATRLHRLESALGRTDAPPTVTRLVVCDLGRTLNLEKSKCTRTLGNGWLTELVDLDGDGTQLSDEELERFVASFPIIRDPKGSASGAGVGQAGVQVRSRKARRGSAGRARKEVFDATD
jgi:hypothetical protein